MKRPWDGWTLSAIGFAAAAIFAGYAEGGILPGYPEDVFSMDSREVAMLPRYCPFTYWYREAGVAGSNNPAEVARWTALLGPTFGALHHYCMGIQKTNRALIIATDQTTKRYYLNSAISEFDYVISRAPPDFVLLPELLTKKGENLFRLGKDRDGVEVLEQAIRIKKDFPPAYGALSDYYKGKGDNGKALQIAKTGLAASPDAKGLKMRVDELEAIPAKGKR
jgi:hypothetical protein